MSLAQLILATATQDNINRANAEKQLQDAFKTDPGTFIFACSQEFAEQNLPDELRPQAAILLKYYLLNFEGGKLLLWDHVGPDVRARVKANLLTVLAYKNDIIRKTAADLIAIIYEMEAGQGIWDDLPETLAQNCKHNDIEIKKSAICTLGQICEKLKGKYGLSDQIIENILMGICIGMEDNEADDIKLIAIQAFADSLNFVSEFLKKDVYRNYAINLLLKRSSSQNNKAVIIKALQALMEFVKIYYIYLEDILKTLWDNTSPYLSLDDAELCISALEVYNVIAREDKDRSNKGGRGSAFGNKPEKDITLKLEPGLVPILFQNLLEKNKYRDEGAIIYATKDCLTSVCGAIKDKFLDYNKEFLKRFLMSTNQLEKRAALIAYACMLDGPTLQLLAELVTDAIPAIGDILANENEPHVIRLEASNALLATAENVPMVYLQETLFLNILPILTKAVYAHPLISINISKLWQHLGDELGKREANIDLSELIDALIMNAFRDDIADPSEGFFILIDQTLLAVTTLIKNIVKGDARYSYLDKLVTAFKKTIEVNGERRGLIQTGLLICLQILLYKLEFNDGIPQILYDIYSLVLDMFRANNDITPDGIHIIGGLAACLGPNFSQFSKDALPFIGKGIQTTNHLELFSASLEAIIHISTACPNEIAGNLQEIIKILLGLLGDQSFDKNIKLNIIIAIGDIALGCKDLMAPYIADIMKIYKMAMEAALTIPGSDQSDMQDYLELLREHLLDSFTGFIHALDNNPALLEHFDFVFHFINETCKEQYDPTREYIKNSLALIADIGYMFMGKVKHLVKSELTLRLIKVLQGFGDNVEYQQTISYTQEMANKL